MKNSILFIILLVVWYLTNTNLIGKYYKLMASQENEVFVVSHGWHTGFVVSSAGINEKIPNLKDRFRKTKFFEFGWGDKDFYQTKDFSLSLTASAILWPTDSVMHVVAVPTMVENYFSNSEVVKICLSEKQFSTLILFISKSFFRDKKGNLEKLQKGLYGNSQFYKGVGDFHLMNTCNRWVAKGLQSVGLEISTTYKLTASSIMNYLTKVKKNTNLGSSFECKVKLN